MTILQSLTKLYDQLDRRGVVPLQGYARVGVSFAIPISTSGEVSPAIDLRTQNGRAKVPLYRNMPKLRDHNNSGNDPFLFWDNTGYALGLVKKEMKRGSPDELFASFREVNLQATAKAASRELTAFSAFLRRWSPDQAERLRIAPEHLDANVAFRCVETGSFIHECLEARNIWDRARQSVNASRRICLVTGQDAQIARLHPKFPALEAGGSKAPIVSFDKSAFTSYDKDQGENAPVSNEAAFKYGAALSWLLDRANARSFRLGETTVVFWADEKTVDGGEENALTIEEALATEFGRPAASPTTPETDDDVDDGDEIDVDADQQQVMVQQADDARTQRAAPNLAKLSPNARLHILGLSPNAGRIAVRFWLVDTWGHVADNIAAHHTGMHIEPKDKTSNRKPYALLYETAAQGDEKNIPPRLGGELARAILTGGAYPRTFYTALLARIRTDKAVNAARVGLCKAIINREHGTEVIPVALDAENPNPAYRLGRLFALIEGAQKAALPGIKATVKDRFFGSACATPARIFPLLHKNAINHIAAVRKERGGGLAHWMEQEIGAVWSGLSDDLPRALKLEEQGRFIAGYYHQRFAKAAGTPVEAVELMTVNDEDESK